MSRGELVTVERELDLMRPNFEQMLAASGVPTDRLVRSILVSCERNPQLLNPEKCSRPSLMASAMSAAAVGLEVDGVTGQAFIIPFGGRAQLVIGYKGYNTLAARAGFTIDGDVICEHDIWDFDRFNNKATHKWDIDQDRGKMRGVWARARSNHQPPIGPVILSMAGILAVKAKSPGGRKKDNPWNDPAIGFPAMAVKTAKRRLARAMPLNTQLGRAAHLDEAYEERGLHAAINSDGDLEVEGEGRLHPSQISYREPEQAELDTGGDSFTVALADGTEQHFHTLSEWAGYMQRGLESIAKSGDDKRLDGFMNRNASEMMRIKGLGHQQDETVSHLIERSAKLKSEMQNASS